jgi:prevent-host-death family protein
MRTIKASTFKAKCLALMDEVARTRKPIVITKNGTPVAELVPHDPAQAAVPLGVWRDLVTVQGDILAPIEAEWDALK